jgi:hypothetical protein
MAVAGTVVSLVALAGCSSSGKAITPVAGSTASGGSTGGAGTSGSGGGANPPALTAAGTLQLSLTKMASENSVKITGATSGGTAGTSSTLSGVYQGSPAEFDMNVVTTGGTYSGNTGMVYDGTDFYLEVPEMQAMAGGKPWVEFTPASLTTGFGAAFAPMVNMLKNNSGGVQLQAMLASGSLQDLGPGTVDGVQATQYSGTLSSAQMAAVDSVSGLTAAQVAQVKQLFQESGTTSEQINLWIDSNGLPVQVKVVTTSSTIGTTTDVTDFSDWGAPVTITVPPAGEIGTLTIPGT